MQSHKGRVLIIAGSDSGGGAGIQGDIKTVMALGGYAMTAITALTAQDTTGVHGIYAVPETFVARQVKLALEDIGADAIKTGMLLSSAVINAVADALEPYGDIPLVLDPVMIAKGGASLIDGEAAEALKRRLIPRALLLTPNVPEAEALCGRKITSLDSMKHAAEALLALGSRFVLLKGGHREGSEVTDLLIARNQPAMMFTSPRIDTRHTHGTGCALASAIATGLAQGMKLPEAASRAEAYVHEAIRTAPGLGKGHGPLNPGHRFTREN